MKKHKFSNRQISYDMHTCHMTKVLEKSMVKKPDMQEGFTLIEIIITVAILAIFSLPVLNYFSDANQHNTRAKVKQNAVVAAQAALEELKAESVDLMTPDKITDVTNEPDISKGWTLITAPDATGKYSIAKPCSVNGAMYKVQADITPVEQFQNGSGTNITYKEMEQPTMNQATDVIATETATVMVDVENYFYGVYSNYCDNNGVAADPSVTFTSISNHLKRTIGIKLDKDATKAGNALVTIYYRYIYELQAGESYPSGIDASTFYDKEIKRRSIKGTDLADIYIFYIANDKGDTLLVDSEIAPATLGINTEQLKLYLIAQNSVKFNTGGGTIPERPDTYKMTLPTTCKNNFHSYFSMLFTNLDTTEVNTGNFGSKMATESSSYTLVRKTEKQRVAQIKLSVYRGDSLASENYCLSIEGTKVQD